MPVTLWALCALVPGVVLVAALLRRRNVPGVDALILHTIVSGFWLLTYALQLDSPDVQTALFWRKITYLGVVLTPVCWAIFALHYTGVGRVLTRWRLAALLAVPAVTFVLALTNDSHQLVWVGTPTTVDDVGTMAYGPAFVAFVAFAYLSLLLASVVLVRTLARSGRLYLSQIVALLVAIGLPWGASVGCLLGLIPVPGLDPIPAAYVAMNLVLGWSLLRHNVLIGSVGVIPHARDRIVDAMRDGVIVLDGSWRIVDVNPAASRLLDRPRQGLIGAPLATVLPSLAPALDTDHSSGPEQAVELVLGAGLSARHCVAHLMPVTGATVSTTGWLLTLNDVTERRRAEAALEESERRYRTVVDSLSEVVFQTDAERRLILLNPAWLMVTGFGVTETLGSSINVYVHPEDRSQDDREAAGLLDGTRTQARYELRFVRQNGEIRWLEVHAHPVRAADGSIIGVSGTLVDVTDRKQLSEQLLHQAFHDALTGLANRTLFIERVTHTLSRAGRVPTSHAVLFLDLDNFKKVNDSLGHAAGDDLLSGVARRLVTSVRASDTVARFGGDEFAILLEDLVQPDDVLAATERILGAFREPVMVGGREVFVGASIGVAPLGRDIQSADMLLRNADIAMYAAKRQGRGGYVVYSDGMDTATRHKLELEADLYRAIGRDELVAMYQPTVEVTTGRIIGAEALVRWQHPTRGLIHPAEFIAIAEETGLIVPIGRWVLRQACRDGRRWQDSNPEYSGLSIAVNISARQLQDARLVDDVAAVLAEFELPPASLTLEITESVAMQNTEATIARLGALKALGVRLAIDDFGTGYSSLSYLQRFPIDVLKIDRAFVQGIAENEDDEALAHTIVQLARTLRLKTVAEGIETVEQLERLRALGCDHGQGYYFARPMLGEQIAALLAATPHLTDRAVA